MSGWSGAGEAAALLVGPVVEPLAVRVVLARHGRPVQPAPGSYSAAELAAWLSVTAYSPGERAALELVVNHREWLEREDWRELCVSIVDAGGRRLAVVEWERWAGALEEHRLYEMSRPAERGVLSAGLHHSPAAATVAHLAYWLARDPLGLRRLGLVDARCVVGAVATACGHPAGAVMGEAWPLEPGRWINGGPIISEVTR